MGSSGDLRRNNLALPLVGGVLALLLLILSLVSVIRHPETYGTAWWRVLLAVLSLGATSLLLKGMENHFSGSGVISIPLFLIVALASPASLVAAPQHLMAPVLVLTHGYLLELRNPSQRRDLSFSLFFLLVAASFFCPPILWLLPFYFIFGFLGGKNKFRYAFSLLLAWVSALALAAALTFLFAGAERILPLAGRYFGGTVRLAPLHLSALSPVDWVRYGLFGILFVVVSIRSLLGTRRGTIEEENLILSTVLLTVLNGLLNLLFFGNPPGGFDCVIAANATTLISWYFVRGRRR